jgi:hypothetical protein
VTGKENMPGIRHPVAVAAVLAMLLVPAGSRTTSAQDVIEAPPPAAPAVSAQTLDGAINEVISQPEYTWRLPRERVETKESQTWNAFWAGVDKWLQDSMESVLRVLRKIQDWLDRLFPERERAPAENVDWLTPVQVLLFVVTAVAASILAILVYRLWKRRQQTRPTVLAGAAPPSADILNEDVQADARPSDEWMDLARQLMERGEWRLAIRAMFLACIAALADSGRLTIAKHKSNREYLGELQRKAHDRPTALVAFTRNVQMLERVWYGDHAATPDMAREFTDNQNAVLAPERAAVHEERP